MTRLQLNVGHAHKVTPRELVGAIAGECGIPGRCIGAIDIQDRFCVVEIAEELADDVLAVLNDRVFISGARVAAKKDGSAGTSAPRKPFAPGTRRQHPGKFGKKPRGATTGRKLYRDPTHKPEAAAPHEERASERPLKRRPNTEDY